MAAKAHPNIHTLASDSFLYNRCTAAHEVQIRSPGAIVSYAIRNQMVDDNDPFSEEPLPKEPLVILLSFMQWYHTFLSQERTNRNLDGWDISEDSRKASIDLPMFRIVLKVSDKGSLKIYLSDPPPTK